MQKQSVIKKKKKKRHKIIESVLVQTFAHPTSCTSHPVAGLAALTRLAPPGDRGNDLVIPVAIPATPFPPAGSHRTQLSTTLFRSVFHPRPAQSWSAGEAISCPAPFTAQGGTKRFALAVRSLLTRVISITASGK